MRGLLHADPVGGLVLQRGVSDGAVGEAVKVLLAVALHAVVHDVVLGGQKLGELQKMIGLDVNFLFSFQLSIDYSDTESSLLLTDCLTVTLFQIINGVTVSNFQNFEIFKYNGKA